MIPVIPFWREARNIRENIETGTEEPNRLQPAQTQGIIAECRIQRHLQVTAVIESLPLRHTLRRKALAEHSTLSCNVFDGSEAVHVSVILSQGPKSRLSRPLEICFPQCGQCPCGVGQGPGSQSRVNRHPRHQSGVSSKCRIAASWRLTSVPQSVHGRLEELFQINSRN